MVSHGVAASHGVDFATVSDCDRLSFGQTYARDGKLDQRIATGVEEH